MDMQAIANRLDEILARLKTIQPRRILSPNAALVVSPSGGMHRGAEVPAPRSDRGET